MEKIINEIEGLICVADQLYGESIIKVCNKEVFDTEVLLKAKEIITGGRFKYIAKYIVENSEHIKK